MKTSLFLSLYALTLMCRAEIVVGPSSATNRLAIETNQIVVIFGVFGEDPEEQPIPTVTLGDRTAAARLEIPAIIAGPGDLVFTNRVMVSFRRLRNSGFRSVLSAQNLSPVTVTVPEGETLRIAYGTFLAQFATAHGPVAGEVGTGHEFSGPLTMNVAPAGNGNGKLISYFMTEDFAVIPDLGLLRGPTGTFEITVERSSDLKTWQPVVIHPSSSEQRAFYRMRIAK